MNESTRAMVQVAVALTLGCESDLAKHVTAAQQTGANKLDLQEVLAIVRSMKLSAAMTVDEAADQMIREPGAELLVLTAQGSSCGCGPGKC